MAKTVSEDLFTSLGAPGEYLNYVYNQEARRIDDLSLTDYRTMLDNDGQIQMLWNAIVNTILSSGIEIEEGQAWDKEGDSPEKQFLEKNLLTPTWAGGMSIPMDTVNRIMLRAFVEGFRVFEVIYRKGANRLIELEKLAPRAGINDWDFMLLVDDNANFVGFKQVTQFNGKSINIKVFNEGPFHKAVKATFGEEFNSIYGRSGLKAAWYHYDKAHKGMFLNHVAHELGAVKFRYLKTATGVPESTIQSALRTLEKVGQESVIALSKEAMELEVLDMSDAATMEQGRSMIELHYSMISKSILAQFVDLGSTITQTGSRSLGQSQQEFFKTGLQALADILIERTWDTVTSDLCKINFASGNFPRLRVKPISDNKADLLKEVFIEMIKRGSIPQSISDEIFVKGSDYAGLDVTSEDIQEEREIMNEINSRPIVQPTAQMSEVKLSMPNMDEAVPTSLDGFRPLYLDEQKVKFVDIKRKLERSEQEAKMVLANKLETQKQGIVDAYIRAIREGKKSLGNVPIDLAEDTYSEALMNIALELAEYGKIVAANELQVSVPQTNKANRSEITDMVNDAITDQEVRLRLRLVSIARTALENSLPENEVRILLEQDYDNFFKSVLAPTVGAILPKALNKGRAITFSKNASKIFAYRYSAVIDSKTTEYCRELDGRVFQSTDPNFALLTPPNHFNCRSVWVPITREEAQQEDVVVDGKPSDLPVYGSLSSFKDNVEASDIHTHDLDAELVQLLTRHGR